LSAFGKILSLGILLGLSSISDAATREAFKLTIHYSSSAEVRPQSLLKYDSLHSTIVEALDEAQNKLKLLWQTGHLSAGIDSTLADSSTLHVWMFCGRRYQVSYLNTDDITDDWLPGWFVRKGKGTKLAPDDVWRVAEKILDKAENTGRPFATVRIDSVGTKGDGIHAAIHLKQGPLYVYDSIEVYGDASISERFLSYYLNIRKGDVYSEQSIRRIQRKLSQLPYVRVTQQSRVFFGEGKVRFHLFLDEKKSDRFDGIVGFAPNSESINNELLVTGEVHVELQNLFRRGVGFSSHWRSFLTQSQELDLSAAVPYLFATNIGVDGDLNLLKLDTSFLNLQSGIGARFILEGTDHVRVYYRSKSTTLITSDTSAIRNNRRLPENNPVRISSYGCDVHLNKLDYRFNPRRGFELSLDANIGSRRIQRDAKIDAVEWINEQGALTSVYDLLDLKSIQFQYQYDLKVFVPVRAKSALMVQASGMQLFAQEILRNDLYRIGGARSLRGFDERSIEGHVIHGGTLEYRYLFSRDANFHVFGNAAYIENSVRQPYSTDLAYGFGAGVRLQVGTSLLNFDYALGAIGDLGIQFNRAKVHFGVINYL